VLCTGVGRIMHEGDQPILLGQHTLWKQIPFWCHLVPNCTVAQPVTTSVDSVQLIWEGMHEANGAGRRQGGLASGVGDAVTPRAPVWHTVAAHVGAADDATRNTPNAVCIPQTQQPREGRAGRHKDAATDRSGHTT